MGYVAPCHVSFSLPLILDCMGISSDAVTQTAVSSKGHPCLKQTSNIKLNRRPVFTDVFGHGEGGDKIMLCTGRPSGPCQRKR